jgi:hypothetical protein
VVFLWWAIQSLAGVVRWLPVRRSEASPDERALRAVAAAFLFLLLEAQFTGNLNASRLLFTLSPVLLMGSKQPQSI